MGQNGLPGALRRLPDTPHRAAHRAEVLEIDDLKERLIEIDENLARVGLSVIDEGEQHEERQQIAEALGMARKAGGDHSAKFCAHRALTKLATPSY